MKTEYVGKGQDFGIESVLLSVTVVCCLSE